MGVGQTYPLAPSLQGRGMVALTPAPLPGGEGVDSGWRGNDERLRGTKGDR